MTKFRRARWVVLTPLVVASSAALVAARPAPPRACDIAAKWVADHRGSLPQTLGAIMQLPPSYRRYVYAALSPDARVQIWRTRLEAYLVADSSLNTAQLTYIRESIALLPSIVGDTSPARTREFIRSQHLEDRAVTLFGAIKARRIFVLPFSESADDTSASQTAEPSSGPNADAPELYFCQCGGSFWDCGGFTCTPGGCIPVDFGCGFDGSQSCDGSCPGRQT